jgi:hypothetical protein
MVDLEEIVRFAFLKYRLSGKKSMNTYIFSQAKKYNLKDKQIDDLIDVLEIKINKYLDEKHKKELQELEDEIDLQNSKIIIKGMMI